jgi:hypothetical protein
MQTNCCVPHFQASEIVSRQLRHMQELRDFERGIVTRAEEILVSGQGEPRNRRGSRASGRRIDLLKRSGATVEGITAGPVARPVMRIQGSRNLLNTSTSDSDEEDHLSLGEDSLPAQDNPMLRTKTSTDAATPTPDVPVTPSKRVASPGRGFGRGFGKSRPSLGVINKETAIPEAEREESLRDLSELNADSAATPPPPQVSPFYYNFYLSISSLAQCPLSHLFLRGSGDKWRPSLCPRPPPARSPHSLCYPR